MLPPAVLPRMASLVRLLGSPIDGEALGAARALARTLATHGSDLHALADHVQCSAPPAAEPKQQASKKTTKKPASRPRPADPPPRPSPQPKPPRPDLVELSPEQRAAIVEGLSEAVEDADGRLSDWQRSFARNLLDTVGRRRLCPTERQMQFVRDILATMGSEA